MRANYSDHIDAARRGLEKAQASLQAELAGYPTPVAGCDAQYTHLLAERRRVRDALAALETKIFLPTPRQLRPGDGIESR